MKDIYNVLLVAILHFLYLTNGLFSFFLVIRLTAWEAFNFSRICDLGMMHCDGSTEVAADDGTAFVGLP